MFDGFADSAQPIGESRAGFGQRDVTGCSNEEENPEPRLERLDRLADGARRDAQLLRGGAKTRETRDGKELGQAFEQISLRRGGHRLFSHTIQAIAYSIGYQLNAVGLDFVNTPKR